MIADNRFSSGFHRQEWWSWLIGTAFFCGEIGGGLFLVSLLVDNWVGMLLGYLIVNIGKNTAHLLYLGKPLRFWRAAMRPDRSWIARGIWATGVFMASGFFVLFPEAFAPVWAPGEGAAKAIATVAGASALFIMFYDGFVMNASRGIAFWRTNLLPLMCLTYAALGGTTLTLLLLVVQGRAVPPPLATLEYILLALNLVILALYLYRMSDGHPAAAGTVHLLLRGRYSRVFLGLVVAVGLLGTALFAVMHAWTELHWIVFLVAGCELVGDYALLMVLLKSGLLASQTAPPARTANPYPAVLERRAGAAS